jgi:hypothetical protein
LGVAPSRLPAFDLEDLETVREMTCLRGKQPQALAQIGPETLRQFLQEICGAAALDAMKRGGDRY